MELSFAQLQSLLSEAAEQGAKKALISVGKISPFISRSEAYRRYGKRQVDRWIAEGIVSVIKDGTNTSKTRIDLMQIETVAKASNRISWYNHKSA